MLEILKQENDYIFLPIYGTSRYLRLVTRVTLLIQHRTISISLGRPPSLTVMPSGIDDIRM